MIFQDEQLALGGDLDLATVDTHDAGLVAPAEERALGGMAGAIGGDGLDPDEIGVAAVGVGLDDLGLDAQALEDGGGVDEIDLVAADPAQEATLDRAGERIGVEIDDLAPIGDAQGGDLAGRNLLHQGAEFRAEVEIVRAVSRWPASIEGTLTALRMIPPLSTSAICSAISMPNDFLRLGGGSAEMWG